MGRAPPVAQYVRVQAGHRRFRSDGVQGHAQPWDRRAHARLPSPAKQVITLRSFCFVLIWPSKARLYL